MSRLGLNQATKAVVLCRLREIGNLDRVLGLVCVEFTVGMDQRGLHAEQSNAKNH